MMDGVKRLFSGFFCLLLISVLSLLGLAITLNLTVLNPDFVVAELRQLDIYSQLARQLESFLQGQGISGGDGGAALSGIEPELEQEVENVVRRLYGSVDKGEIGTAIYLGGIKEIMKEYAASAMSLSPEPQGALTGDMEAVISRIYSEIDSIMPETILLNGSVLGSGAIAPLNLISQLPAYLGTAQRVLIILAVVLVLLICLVHWWQPKAIAQALGVVFITVGVGCVVISLFGSLGDVLLGFFPVPSGAYSQLQSSLLHLFKDILMPMRMYGFGFAGAGICLIIVSLLWSTVLTGVYAMPRHGGGRA